MPDEFAFLDATAQAELVRRRDVRPLELVDAAITRIEQLNPMNLPQAQQNILRAMAAGWTLKSHRDVEGAKVCQLHPLHGPAKIVRRATVESLQERGLIDSNKKFPVATYWLTERGKALAARLKEQGA